MTDRRPSTRRSFLRDSFAAASGLAAFRLLVTPAFGSLLASDPPVASTLAGRVRGYVDNGITVFKGIRYGADTSNRRFMPPVTPEPWTEVRDALAYGPSAPQSSRSSEKASEDCLFLNVWTPALRDRRKRPVMFYIHGGAYNNGS